MDDRRVPSDRAIRLIEPARQAGYLQVTLNIGKFDAMEAILLVLCAVGIVDL